MYPKMVGLPLSITDIALTECSFKPAAWIAGIVQTALYADFFYYYLKRFAQAFFKFVVSSCVVV
jgi:hypothetical protein